MVRSGKVVFSLLAWIIAVYANNISLSGTIKDEQGEPVSDAVVTTTLFQYSDYYEQAVAVTDEQGKFILEFTGTRPVEKSRRKAVPQFAIKNNVLEFKTSSEPVSGKLNILTLDGKRIFSAPINNPASGKKGLSIPIPESYGFYLMSLDANGATFTGKLLYFGKWVLTMKGFESSRTLDKSMLAGTDEFLDTLLVYKKNFINIRLPIDSYTKSDLKLTLTEGVIHGLFLSETMIQGWKPGKSTFDSSFTLWNASDIFANINGGGEKYITRGMLQAIDMHMTGPDNPDGESCTLEPQSTFIMDFGIEDSARAMYLYQREKILEYYKEELIYVDGFSDSVALATTFLGGVTLYSYQKQFYFELCLNNFIAAEDALAAAKTFLEYFLSKIE